MATGLPSIFDRRRENLAARASNRTVTARPTARNRARLARQRAMKAEDDRTVRVLIRKPSGKLVEFGRYAPAEAERMAAGLRKWAIDAQIEPAASTGSSAPNSSRDAGPALP